MTPVTATPTFRVTLSPSTTPPTGPGGTVVIPPTDPAVDPGLSGPDGPVVAEPSFELRRSTSPGSPGVSLDGIVYDASIDLDNDRDILRSARLSLNVSTVDIDPDADLVAISWRLRLPTGVAEFPLGVYLLDEPKRRYRPAGDGSIIELWDAAASDLNALLQDARTSTAHTIASGENYVSGTNGVRDILNSIGVSHNIPDPGLVTPAYFTWAPGTTALEIINFLLRAINYYPIWPDNDAVFVSRERVDPEFEAPAVVYSSSTEPKMIVNEFVQTRARGRFANRIAVLIDHPQRAADYRIALNDDPTSPASTQQQTVLITEEVDGALVANTTTAQSVATFLVKEAAARAEAGQLETLIDPRRSPHEFYRLDIPGLEQATLWRVQGWSMRLSVDQPMRHDIGRARAITVST